MSIPFQKFNQFIEELAKQVHNLNVDTLKVFLTNSVPDPSNIVKSDIFELDAGNGYVAGGNVAAFTSGFQTDGVYKLVIADPAVWTCVTAPMGPFQYAVLYNDTPPTKPLIAWWDYGAPITLQIGETFLVDLDQVNGVLTIA